MILIPELRIVYLAVPRTGTTSFKNAILARWPQAMPIYRHMEADGLPLGYESWTKVGVIRRPISRLWSLYSYCAGLTENSPNWAPDRAQRMRASTEGLSFEAWLLTNETVFALDIPLPGELPRPYYLTLHPLPENRKSQWRYLRPDLGTQVYRFEDQLPALAKLLDIDPPKSNGSTKFPAPQIRRPDMILRELEWDAMRAGGWQ